MDFLNTSDQLTLAEIKLNEFLTKQFKNSLTYFGYPEIPKNDDLAILGASGLAKLHLNNAGDPWVQGNSKMHTKEFEQEVIAFVADLYNLNNYWGYITNGGTEGNLYGMYMAREYFKSIHKTPYFLYPNSSHYSVHKNAHILNLNAISLDTESFGELKYSDLKEKIIQIKKTTPNFGLIINLNIGTTMAGAVDSLAKIFKITDALEILRESIFVHADAAILGFIYPFLSNKEELFKLGLSSIAISGHKFLGTIRPCGVFLTKKSTHQQTFKDSSWISYIASNDSTITGSRNGFLALILWYIIQKKGKKVLKDEAKTCIENAQYLYQKLKTIGYSGVNYNPNQIIVTFDKPSEEIIKKYQLAINHNKAHVVVMQHITKHLIDQFCESLSLTSNVCEL